MGVVEVLAVIKEHWTIILTIVGVLVSLLWLKLDSRYAKKSDVGEIKDEVENINDKLQALEGDIKHLPSARDVTEMRIALTEMKGESQVLRTSIKSLSHQVSLLVEKEVSKKR